MMGAKFSPAFSPSEFSLMCEDSSCFPPIFILCISFSGWTGGLQRHARHHVQPHARHHVQPHARHHRIIFFLKFFSTSLWTLFLIKLSLSLSLSLCSVGRGCAVQRHARHHYIWPARSLSEPCASGLLWPRTASRC